MVQSRNFYDIDQMSGVVILCISDLILECFLFNKMFHLTWSNPESVWSTL